MSDPNIVSVKIIGDESSLKEALDKGIHELNRFSRRSNRVLRQIEVNTGGLLLKLQRLTVALHGVAAGLKWGSSLFRSFIQQAESIDQLSKSLGLSIEEFGKLKYVAEQSGTSMEVLTEAMKALNNDNGKLFNIGIDPESFSSKGMLEQLDMLAERIIAIQDPTERAQVAFELFGESGLQLLPMLERGSDGLHALTQEAANSGTIMKDKVCSNAVALSKSIEKLQTVSKNLGNEILSALTPALFVLVELASKAMKEINLFIERHPIISKAIISAITVIAILTLGVKALTLAFGGLNIVTGGFLTFIGLLTTAVVAMVELSSSTSNQTDEIKKQREETERLRKAQEASTAAEQKRIDAAQKAAEAAKKAQEAQKGIADAEKSLEDAGKSSAQKEVEKIDEDITTFKSNWHTRKNWLRQQANKRKLTKEEQTELDSMTPERYYDYINAQKRRQNEIRSGLSHRDYQPENPESDAVRAAQDNLDALRARGASAPEVAQAEKAVKEAEMRFTQVALQSSGQEKEQARRDYLAAKEAYENSGDKNEFEQEALYKAMVEAQKKSQEADANFTRLAEENYKMHEVKIPEYEYKSVGGTFNAFAVAALGADIPKQQLEVLQQVAGKMDDIINNQQEAGVFA